MTSNGFPLILFRTNFFRESPLQRIADSEWRHCFTTDQSRLAEADAVVFHIPELRWDPVESTPRYPGQKWVAWSMESNVNYPELADPGVMGAYDLTMTYARASDVWAPYLPPLEAWRRARLATLPRKSATAPVAMFQSAADDHSARNALAAELMQHIDVHSYGRFMNNRALAGPDRGRASKHETIAAYPFCLAFENSIAPDYVTEKIYDCLLTGTVPIYLGAPNVDELVPEGCYIDARAHGDPRGLAAYLDHLLQRPDEYAAYLAWRDRPLPPKLVSLIETASTSALLRLLDLLPRAAAAPVAPWQPSAAGDAAPPALLAPAVPLQPAVAPDRWRRYLPALSPRRIRLVKAGLIAAVWLVGLTFLDAGWPAPLFAVTAAAAWLSGARWLAHVGAAALVAGMLVRIGALPPPATWQFPTSMAQLPSR
jgi:hypothetical protein